MIFSTLTILACSLAITGVASTSVEQSNDGTGSAHIDRPNIANGNNVDAGARRHAGLNAAAPGGIDSPLRHALFNFVQHVKIPPAITADPDKTALPPREPAPMDKLMSIVTGLAGTLPLDKLTGVLGELPAEDIASTLNSLPLDEIADALHNRPVNNLADLLSILPARTLATVLSKLPIKPRAVDTPDPLPADELNTIFGSIGRNN